MDKVSDTPNQDEVICPACSHQFRAIPENVQSELAAQKEQLRLCNVDQFSTAAELAALKEQYRVLEDEMLVMMDERNAAVARSINLLKLHKEVE